MTTKKRAQGGPKGKAGASGSARAAAALFALSKAGDFDFIAHMLGATVEDVCEHLDIEPPDNWRHPTKESTAADFERWLEKVPPTFDLLDPDDKRPRELYNDKGTQRNPFDTTEEAAEVIEAFCSHLFSRGEAASLFLLIMYAMANEHDEGTRSCMYYDACRYLTGEIRGVEATFEADHVRVLAEWRKGDGE